MGLVVLNIKVKHGELTVGNITARSKEANTSRIDQLTIPNIGQRLFYLSSNPNNVTRALDGTFEWASEIITQGGRTQGGYLGFVSNQYSNSDRNFIHSIPELEIEFLGSGILPIFFDRLQGNFASQIEINGELYTNDRSIFYHNVTEQSPLRIRFLQLNRPFQPLEITGIFGNLEEEFSDDDIESYSFGRQSQDTSERPRYSVISQSGSIIVKNKHGLFTKLEELDMPDENIECEVIVNKNKFGTYILTNSKMADFEDIVSFDLTDKLFELDKNEWNAVTTPFLKVDVFIIEFFEFIVARINELTRRDGETEAAFSLRIQQYYTFFDIKTRDIFQRTLIPLPILNVRSIKEALNKISEVTYCNIFPNTDGILTVKYSEATSGDL